MNEPSNFESGQISIGCPSNDPLNRPPYTPRFNGGGGDKALDFHTVCPSAVQHLGRHYDLHNCFGFSETIVTNAALKAVRAKKRPFIISRSTFPGQGHYGGHWTGDIHSDWDAMALSIAGKVIRTRQVDVNMRTITTHSSSCYGIRFGHYGI